MKRNHRAALTRVSNCKLLFEIVHGGCINTRFPFRESCTETRKSPFGGNSLEIEIPEHQCEYLLFRIVKLLALVSLRD